MLLVQPVDHHRQYQQMLDGLNEILNENCTSSYWSLIRAEPIQIKFTVVGNTKFYLWTFIVHSSCSDGPLQSLCLALQYPILLLPRWVKVHCRARGLLLTLCWSHWLIKAFFDWELRVYILLTSWLILTSPGNHTPTDKNAWHILTKFPTALPDPPAATATG